MAVNLIVLAVTVLVGGFLVVWLAFPRLRGPIEAPKYRVLEWDRVPPSGTRRPRAGRAPGGPRIDPPGSTT